MKGITSYNIYFNILTPSPVILYISNFTIKARSLYRLGMESERNGNLNLGTLFSYTTFILYNIAHFWIVCYILRIREEVIQTAWWMKFYHWLTCSTAVDYYREAIRLKPDIERWLETEDSMENQGSLTFLNFHVIQRSNLIYL